MKEKYPGKQNMKKRPNIIWQRIRFYFITIAALIIFVLCLFFICKQYLNSDINPVSGNYLNAGLHTENPIDLSVLNSPYAILVDMETGNVVAHRNSEEQINPASLTKIMTAILTVEHISNLNQTITVPNDFFNELYAQEASMAGFEPGEKVKAKDLLYGVLLPSGAECCKTLADDISGSESAFVKLMNEKSKQLGLSNTHFTNSTGLHHNKHYSTVKDIAALLQYALKNKDFRQVFTSSYYSIQPTNRHPEGLTFYSTLYQHKDATTIKNGEILGGKTGYTEQAGLCLASLASINGREYILVTAGAKGGPETEPFHLLDAVTVYNQIGNSNN